LVPLARWGVSRAGKGNRIKLERRDFLKLATTSLASMALIESMPQTAQSANASSLIYSLPKSDFPQMAWTVDDGCSTESLESYIQIAIDNDLRFTFFVYSAMSPWKRRAKLLKPLVESGQIQLANHSHTHRNLTELSFAEVKRDLMNCHNFIEKNYDVDARPYFRAPYGALNSKVIQAAEDIGYTRPVAWTHSLVDMPTQSAKRLQYHADHGFVDGSIVLSHANNLVVSNNIDALLETINERELSLVTLNDVFT
jgi:peptidoglycan/xylan/chitin deacetylase (PgdA/CDA1 family)